MSHRPYYNECRSVCGVSLDHAIVARVQEAAAAFEQELQDLTTRLEAERSAKVAALKDLIQSDASAKQATQEAKAQRERLRLARKQCVDICFDTRARVVRCMSVPLSVAWSLTAVADLRCANQSIGDAVCCARLPARYDQLQQEVAVGLRASRDARDEQRRQQEQHQQRKKKNKMRQKKQRAEPRAAADASSSKSKTVEPGVDPSTATPDDDDTTAADPFSVAGTDNAFDDGQDANGDDFAEFGDCLLYTSPSPRDRG